ncbi:hypothetical protein [Haloparvum sedimenti]|uniref:hypothetical protein n=1 Tax=Haloparvum sedimenti TaxID=1678448 RepID=UPI00071E9011|nr:hypothetical protein [Haloparvum sedimenti]
MAGTDPPPATRVVLSYPENASDWAREQFEADRYRSYFRRSLGAVAVGDVREEFVDVGCCGDSLDVAFRVETIETESGETDSATVTEDTEIAYVDREGDMEGGWRVQSAAGPTE